MRTARVGATGQANRLVQRLRAMTPSWRVSRQEACWIAEQQAKLLLKEARITGPPVPERIVTELDGVNVYQLAPMPAKGLMGVSKPSSRGGDILIDSTLTNAERRVTLMHEFKHIIDGGHTTRPHKAGGSQSSAEGLCTDFALNALIPTAWLHADWQAGQKDISALAERYQVPVQSIRHRLHTLGLLKHKPRRHRHPSCQWRTHVEH